MSQILLMIAHEPNLRLLMQCLENRYLIRLFEEKHWLPALWSVDLIIVDGISLEMHLDDIISAREHVAPLFLPVLLVTTRSQITLATRSLWKHVDEVVIIPVDRLELQARIETLLRARRLSTALHHRNEELEAFVQAAAHELRAPIRAIEGFAQALQEDFQLPEEALPSLQRIVTSAQQMRALLDALLRFSQIGKQVEIQTVYLDALLQTCIDELLAEGIDLRSHLQLHLQWNTVLADLMLLKIAMINLLRNAYQYASPDRPLQIEVRASRRAAICRIEVGDNGIGLRPDDVARMFEPFVRLHERPDRLGLGLSVVKRAVTCMGGRCGALSAPNEGSNFWVELPVAVEGGYNADTDSRQQS